MPAKNINVKVEYLTRVEGHGNILVNVNAGKIEKCEFNVVESPRFFEGMLRGRSIFEAQHITSRICGICACGHSLASIQAGENALGITPTAQAEKLRELLLDMEILDSHILHIYLLAAPDIFKVKSFVGLAKKHVKEVRRGLRMKKNCNAVCDILVGRHVHPITAIIGGFTKIPRPADVDNMLSILYEIRKDMEPTIEFAAKLKFPDFERPTNYAALVSDGGKYPLLHGRIGTTSGKSVNASDYKELIEEFIDPRSSAKFARIDGQPYMVGALARFNLNAAKLHPRAAKAAKFLGLKAPVHNPYLNTTAQAVECVHCLEDAIEILEGFKKRGADIKEEIIVGLNEKKQLPVMAGRGVGAVEVPRGLLIHDYETDSAGRIVNANCIIPTNQNVNNIQQDMVNLLPGILKLGQKQITLRMEMLVRAYDPCISCSAHYVEVKFAD